MLNEHFPDYDPRDGENEQPELSEAQQQWLSSTVRLRPELKTDMRNEHEGLFIVIEDPVRNKFYSVGNKEYRFLASLNGVSTVGDIVNNWNGEEKIDEQTAVTICQWAVQSNLITGDQMDATARLEKQSKAIDRQNLIATFNPISFKFKLFNPNRILQKITRRFSWLFSKTFLAIWIIVGIWGTSCAFGSWERLTTASVGILSGYRWVWLLAVWALLKVIHEAAHGVACRKYGGEVNEAGVLLLLFTPMAYVNVTSSWRFPNRWHRIVVAGAGMYVELFISFVSLIVWSSVSDGIISDICYNIFFMSSVTTILFNANPLMRFDGYYILADSLGITNLYTKGTKLFSDKLKSWFFGVPVTPNICPRKELRIVSTYGTMAFFWKILVSLGLIIGASVLFLGLGKIIAAIGIALFFGVPIWTQLKQLYGPNAASRPANARVAFSSVMVLLGILSTCFLVKAPSSKSAPAIVQFKNETPVRAESAGFVHEILVNDGDSVAKDQTLIVLSNPEIDLEISTLKQEAAAAKIKARIHQQNGELALYQAEIEILDGINKQLGEKECQAQSLTIKAPFDGFVFHRNLNSKTGSFAKLGDTLINMAHEKTKEVVVTIPQQDWESLNGKTGSHMKIAIQSVPIFQGAISRIDGRASDVPKHPSMCANVGGPLPIKTVAGSRDTEAVESDYRLLSPHFNVDLTLDPNVSASLKSGQRGRAFFQTEKQSLGGYMYVAVENWLRNKIEVATQSATF